MRPRKTDPPLAANGEWGAFVLEVTLMPDGNQKAYTALYDVLESADACEESLEAAEHARDEELADFLRHVGDEVRGRAEELLAQRVAE
jgi:hypothetical protein